MLWRCGNCGFVWDGDQPPDKCPNCGFPGEQYSQIAEDEAKLILRSRNSNNLHCRLITMLDKVRAVAADGVEDNLDPMCLAIFTQAKEMSWQISQRSRNEIKVHIGKGKWG